MKVSSVALCVIAVGSAALCFSAQVSHDGQVDAAVNSYLAQGFKSPGNIANSVRIQIALAKATDARDSDTRDTVLRDAEYYLHGLYAMAANDFQHSIGVAGAPVYDAMKWAAFQLKDKGYDGLEKWIRTDPSKPNSAPGGWIWAYKGLEAGFHVDGKREVPGGSVPDSLILK